MFHIPLYQANAWVHQVRTTVPILALKYVPPNHHTLSGSKMEVGRSSSSATSSLRFLFAAAIPAGAEDSKSQGQQSPLSALDGAGQGGRLHLIKLTVHFLVNTYKTGTSMREDSPPGVISGWPLQGWGYAPIFWMPPIYEMDGRLAKKQHRPWLPWKPGSFTVTVYIFCLAAAIADSFSLTLPSCASSTTQSCLHLSHSYFLRDIKLNKLQINSIKHDLVLSCFCFSKLQHRGSPLIYKHHVTPLPFSFFPLLLHSSTTALCCLTLSPCPAPMARLLGSPGYKVFLQSSTASYPPCLKSLTLSMALSTSWHIWKPLFVQTALYLLICSDAQIVSHAQKL